MLVNNVYYALLTNIFNFIFAICVIYNKTFVLPKVPSVRSRMKGRSRMKDPKFTFGIG